MTADVRLAERWDAWSCGNGVSRLFGLADDLDGAYQRLAVTTAGSWTGADRRPSGPGAGCRWRLAR
jgi:hypothetical protein